MKGGPDRKKHGGEVSKTLAPGEPPLFETLPNGRKVFAKGHKLHGGRPHGGLNKSTKALRELVQEINQYGAERGVEWLERTSKRSPSKALLALSRLLEYGIPKMRAVEQTGPGGGPVVVEVVHLDSASTKRPPRESTVQVPQDEES